MDRLVAVDPAERHLAAPGQDGTGEPQLRAARQRRDLGGRGAGVHGRRQQRDRHDHRTPTDHAASIPRALSAPHVLALALAAILGSVAQSATGFGVALPLAPVAFAVLDPADAVLTVAAAALMHNVLVLLTRRRQLAVRRGDAAVLILPALPALAAGALVVSHVSKPPMQLAVGAAILGAVGFRLHEPGRLAALSGRGAGVGIGALAGALTTTVGINGPPMVIWLRARRATITELRDTLAVVFFALNLAAIPSLATRGGSIPAVLLPALAAALLAGHVLGLFAHARLEQRTLDRALVAVLVLAAAASIIGGASALL